MKKIIDLTNNKFGRLLVKKFAGYGSSNKTQWSCDCDCGNTNIVVKGSSLKNGHTKSCGCLEKESKKQASKTHGLRYTRLYGIWLNMKGRCYNSNNSHYKTYGHKGIKLCEQWKNDFKTFHSWAMDNGYAEDLSIERVNNSKDYCPDNCKWIPIHDQSKNRSTNIVFEIDGIKYNAIDLAIKYNIKPSTLYGRISKGITEINELIKPVDNYIIIQKSIKDNKIINTFRTISEAQLKMTGKTNGGLISKSINGITKTAYGYVWERLELTWGKVGKGGDGN